jgi:hypothetical protein
MGAPDKQQWQSQRSRQHANYSYTIHNVLFHEVILSFARATMFPEAWQRTIRAEQAPTKLYKCYTINRLRGKVDKARDGPWRAGANILTSDLALVDMQNAMGRNARCMMSLTAVRILQSS